MRNKLLYAIFFSIITLCIVTLIIFAFVFPRQKNRQAIPTQKTPSPTVSVSNVTPVSNPPVIYSPQGQKRLVQLDQERQALSPTDKAVKDGLIAQLGGKSGILSQDNTYQATYTSVDGSFEVEILTIDIAQAKQNAISWFESKGFSTKALCQLPLSFYLSSTTANQLQNLHVVFNPLPDFCQ